MDWIGLKFMIGFLVVLLVMIFIYTKKRIRFVDFFVRHFERPDALYLGKGLIDMLVGAILVVWIFEPINKNIVLASFMILSIGDSISPIIGMKFGKRVVKIISEKKFIEGILAGIVCSTLGANLFVPFVPALVASTLAMLVEAWELKHKLDDNILILAVSSVVLFFMV
ncbi:hypothetical protein BVX95_00240 [archaeon D22]|nr:hypothetical protein BVX95_00240 [archaeon D22]